MAECFEADINILNGNLDSYIKDSRNDDVDTHITDVCDDNEYDNEYDSKIIDCYIKTPVEDSLQLYKSTKIKKELKIEYLFTFDETKTTEDNYAWHNIQYLDKEKKYVLKKKLGKYILKPHQLTTLYYMIGLEKMIFNTKRIIANKNSPDDNQTELITMNYTNVGILSDKVGSGKSYCVMALINESKQVKQHNLPTKKELFGCQELEIQNPFNMLDTNILLLPHNLVGQWEKYLIGSGLKFYTVRKTKDIFDLADNTCVYKSKKCNILIKENNDYKSKKDIIPDNISNEDEDENEDENEDTNEDLEQTQTIKPKIVIKPKLVKKKVIITKRSKAEIIPTNDNTTNNSNDSPIIKSKEKSINEKTSLETKYKELKKLYNEITAQKRDILIKFWNRSLIKDLTLYDKSKDLEQKEAEIFKQINEIKEQIDNLNVSKCSITTTEINIINNTLEKGCVSNLSSANAKFLENIGLLDKEKIEGYDVIIVSATFWKLFAMYFKKQNYTVNRIIIDECNSIKGSLLPSVSCIFTWLITSSIKSMMTRRGYNINEKYINSTGFILNMVKKLFENQEQNNKIYLVNNPVYIEQSMTLPLLKTYIVISRDSNNIQVLKGVVSPQILQMLNAGDIDGIITKLDVAVADETNVIEIITRKYQDDLKIKEYELRVAIENPKYNPKNESIGLINKRKAIEDLKHKIACIVERVKNVENCPICYDDFINSAITPCCNNKFCFNCIAAALNSKTICPMCKNELEISKLIMISNKQNTITKVKSTSKTQDKALSTVSILDNFLSQSKNLSKHENMDKIFELNSKNTVKKYLIFTEYESTLNTRITSILDKWGLTYARIRGTSYSISNMISKYKQQDNEINVLLINSKYFGSGLNLENTSDIIIIHKMNSDIEMQVIGRAQRFGRVGELRVWKLYYENEIDN